MPSKNLQLQKQGSHRQPLLVSQRLFRARQRTNLPASGAKKQSDKRNQPNGVDTVYLLFSITFPESKLANMCIPSDSASLRTCLEEIFRNICAKRFATIPHLIAEKRD